MYMQLGDAGEATFGEEDIVKQDIFFESIIEMKN